MHFICAVLGISSVLVLPKQWLDETHPEIKSQLVHIEPPFGLVAGVTANSNFVRHPYSHLIPF